MSDYHQYRITVNGSVGPIAGYPDDQWSQVAQFVEDRGGIATLHRRFVTDHDILPMLGDDTAGWIILKDKVISSWEVWAEIEVR